MGRSDDYLPDAPAETTGYERPHDDGPHYDDPDYENPDYESPRYENPAYENPAYESPRYEGAGYESAGYGSAGHDRRHGYRGAVNGGTVDDGAFPESQDPVRGGGPGPEDYERYGIGDDDDDVDVEVGSNATRNALEWAVVLVGAVLVALLLRAALFQAFWIPSESMEDTLEIQDRVLVNKLSYRLHEIHRGDVVVFTRPDDQPGEIRDLIKRVIGIPGDTIEGRDNTVYVNGSMLIEPYLDEGTYTDEFGPIVVPEGQIFVMGDNREESFDSRRFGTVPEDRVVGRAFVLFWPVDRIGWL